MLRVELRDQREEISACATVPHACRRRLSSAPRSIGRSRSFGQAQAEIQAQEKAASSARAEICSFRNAFRRWLSTVLGLMCRSSAIS